jgi:hypothetical protein
MIIIRCPLRITPDGSCLKDVTYIYSGVDRGVERGYSSLSI